MFITFEGPEGSGKSTAMAGVAAHLRASGFPVLCTREPGGSDLGRRLRAILLEGGADIAPQAELMLFLADRAQHVAKVIRPALAGGSIVLCDRFADSTIAYQGYARGLGPERIADACDLAAGGLAPDLTLLLDIPPEQGVARALARNSEEGVTGEDRFDTEVISFHSAVRNGFLALAARYPQRIARIDGSMPRDRVLAACIHEISARLPEERP